MRQHEGDTHAALAPLRSTSTPGAARADLDTAGRTCSQGQREQTWALKGAAQLHRSGHWRQHLQPRSTRAVWSSVGGSTSMQIWTLQAAPAARVNTC
eukprot:scaffold231925_cov24-Tisochrysis_lutea.AAC.1